MKPLGGPQADAILALSQGVLVRTRHCGNWWSPTNLEEFAHLTVDSLEKRGLIRITIDKNVDIARLVASGWDQVSEIRDARERVRPLLEVRS